MNFQDKLTYFSGYLLCLVPFTLLTGPFLPDLLISLICLYFLFISFRYKQWQYYKNYFFYFFFIFSSYLIIRSIFSEFIFISLEASLFYFRFGIFSLAIWFLLNHNKNLIKMFTVILFITFFVAVIDGYFQFIFDQNIFGLTVIGDLEGTRMTLLLNDKSILGGYLVRLFPLLFGLILLNYQKSNIAMLAAFISLILVDVLVFLSGERTAIGLMLIFTILVIILIEKFRILRLIALSISIIIIIIITANNNEIMDRNINQTIAQLNIPQNTNTNNPYIFSKTHDSIFKTAYNMYSQNKLFGIGPKLFREFCKNNNYNKFHVDSEEYELACNTHPHNTYIQLLAETGIVGAFFIFLSFSLISINFMRFIYKKYFVKKIIFDDYQICLLICIFLNLWPLLPSQNFFNNWINIIYFLPIGFLLHSMFSKKEIKK